MSQCYIFAGSIVPILSKILKAGGIQCDSDREAKPYRVVRVDTSKVPAEVDNIEKEGAQSGDDNCDSDGELQVGQALEHATIEVEPLVGGEEDVGKGVARKMTGKIGASVFRGLIVKVGWFAFCVSLASTKKSSCTSHFIISSFNTVVQG
jgi:hypothetical protein